MMNNTVVMERLQEIDRSLSILEELRIVEREEFLADPKHYLLAERCFQLAIECLTDICYYIAGKNGWGKPDDSAEAILLLGKQGVIDEDFAESIVGMANFRNILVHAYLRINRSIVYDYLDRLEDFRKFERQVLAYLGAPPEAP